MYLKGRGGEEVRGGGGWGGEEGCDGLLADHKEYRGMEASSMTKGRAMAWPRDDIWMRGGGG